MKCWFIAALLFLFKVQQSTTEAKNVQIGMDVLRANFISGFLHQLDPLKIKEPIELKIDEKQIKVHGSVDSLTINGLSEFTVDQWHVDAATSKIEFSLNFAKLASTGHYNIDGILINFFPLQGSGNFNVQVKDLRLTGSIQIDQDHNKDLSVKHLLLDIRFGGSTIKLENLGKDSDDTVNEILNVVLVDFYYQHENKIKTEISESIKTIINQYLATNKNINGLVLSSFSPVDEKVDIEPRADINGPVDRIFSSIRISASQGGWDPIRLPSDSDEFSVTLFGATLNGKVAISNARIGGFSTIHRTGPCSTRIRPSTKEATIYVGGNDIEIGVDFMWSAGIFKANLQIEMIVEHVDLMANIIVDSATNSTSLGEFLLNEIGTIKITIGGIPGGGSDVISNRISLLSNLVKDSLIFAFQEALRPMAEKAIKGSMVRSLLAEHNII